MNVEFVKILSSSYAYTCSTVWEDQNWFRCKWIWCIRRCERELSRDFGNICVVDCWYGLWVCKFWCDILAIRALADSDFLGCLQTLAKWFLVLQLRQIFHQAGQPREHSTDWWDWLPQPEKSFFWLWMFLFFVIWDYSDH